jgi:hypothetical protein
MDPARLVCLVSPFSHTGVAMSHWWPLNRFVGTEVGRVTRRGDCARWNTGSAGVRGVMARSASALAP